MIKLEKVLVTGGRSGIIKDVIDKIKDNYIIYLTVHTEKQLEEVKTIYKENKNIICFKLDITNKKDREKIKDLDIDIFISNAAIGSGGSILTMPIEKMKENFEVNVFSNFELVKLVIQKMIEKSSGKIIIISSLASILPIPFLGSYCATKSSISMITNALRKEIKYISKDIKIVLVEPGMYHTGFNQVMLDNKYNIENSYFKNNRNEIRDKENLFFNLIEKQDLSSVSNKIYKIIKAQNPRFRYRVPFFQALGCKLYQIFKM